MYFSFKYKILNINCLQCSQEGWSPFLRRSCDHDRVIWVQLPPSSHMLLHPWIRRFTMIISAR